MYGTLRWVSFNCTDLMLLSSLCATRTQEARGHGFAPDRKKNFVTGVLGAVGHVYDGNAAFRYQQLIIAVVNG